MLFIDEADSYTINFPDQGKEMFNPDLKRLNSIDKVIAYSDSVYADLKLPLFDTASYVRVVNRTVKSRFYHGLSSYSLSENWISYLLGKLCWSHLSAIVNPEDILKYPEGLCSQQNIVFMEVLKNKKITYRAVGLGTSEGPGHFLIEVMYGSKWHLFDVDLEPNWTVTNHIHESMEDLLLNKPLLYKIYENRISVSRLEKITQVVSYGKPNNFPAKKMLFFHRVTLALGYILPLFFLGMFIWMCKKNK